MDIVEIQAVYYMVAATGIFGAAIYYVYRALRRKKWNLFSRRYFDHFFDFR